MLPLSKRLLQASGIHIPLIASFLFCQVTSFDTNKPVNSESTILFLTCSRAPSEIQFRAVSDPKLENNEWGFCTRDLMDKRCDLVGSVVNSRRL